jgi:SAM-dependent methyltransferase
MFVGSNIDHYLSVGRSALQSVRIALELAGAPGPKRILDLPSGYGRVLRMLRYQYPDAEIAACDIDVDAIQFCAQEFGAIPIPGKEECTQTPLRGGYDLIWCGSLLTHFNAEKIKCVLRLFADHLSTGGVLVATTHGRRPIELYRGGVLKYFGPDEDHLFEEVIRQYKDTGFGYNNYSHTSTYGVSLSTPAWIARELEALPELHLLIYQEAGWSDHQDIVACLKK